MNSLSQYMIFSHKHCENKLHSFPAAMVFNEIRTTSFNLPRRMASAKVKIVRSDKIII